MGASKQINAEAAPVAYSGVHFSFDDLPALNTFLNDIGTMRKFLKHVCLRRSAYHKSLASPAFHKLKDAKGLRSLTLHHVTICQERERSEFDYKPVSLDKVIADLKPLMGVLHKAQKSSDSPINALDILKVACELLMDPCQDGKEGRLCNHTPAPYPCCDKRCHEWEQHAKETEDFLRAKLTEALGLKDTLQ